MFVSFVIAAACGGTTGSDDAGTDGSANDGR